MSSNLIVNNIEVGAGATIYTAASNQLAFGTNGSEKVRIDSSGHLILGTTSTSNAEQFRIHTSDSGKAIIKLTNSTTGTGTGDGFEFGLNGNEQIEFFNKENTDMFFGTNNLERLRIASNGRVGILTVTPEARLDVYDTSGLGIISRSASTQATDSNKALKVRNNSSTDTFSVSYKGKGYFAGNVGIGTEAGSDLHLLGDAPVMKITPTNWQSGFRVDVLGMGNNAGNGQLFRIQKDGSTKFQINEDADVVVYGDDNAELKLQCGTSTGNNIIGFLNSSGTTKGNIFYDSDNNFMVFKTNGSASANERLRITSDGYVGIKRSTPLANLHTTNNELAIGANPTSAAAPNATYDGLVVDGEAGSFINIRSRGNGSNSYGRVAFSDDVRSRGYIEYRHKDGTGDDWLGLATSGSEKLRITSAGLFGFNNSSPGGACIDATHSRTNAYGATSDHRSLAQIVARNASDAAGRFASISLVSGGGTQAEASINLVQTANYTGDLTFKSRTAVSGWTEKVRITSSGNIYTNGNTSLPTGSTSGFGFSQDQFYISYTGTSANYIQRFYNGNGLVGSILVSGSATAYNTSSDYRLKENEVAISDGITRLKTLKPYRFNFKTDPSKTVDGFFAHEVTAVPEAIAGEKDGTEMQGIDQSKLVPLLTAALQEAITKIETLETEVAALR